MLFTKFAPSIISVFSLAAYTLAVVMPPRSELESRVYPRATELIQSGSVFTIHNVKADTVVDLSAGDNTTSELPLFFFFLLSFSLSRFANYSHRLVSQRR